MKERGFYSKSIGYWQTTGDPAPDIKATYPPDTVEVGLPPTETSIFDGTKWVDPGAVVLPEDVNAERDQRIAAGISFNGTLFGSDPRSIQNITGAGSLAGLAVGAGAKAGDLLWMGGTTPFAWIAADNTAVPMDAPTMFAFSQAAFRHVAGITFAARALKDMPTIPQDFRNAKYWP